MDNYKWNAPDNDPYIFQIPKFLEQVMGLWNDAVWARTTG